MWWCGGEGVSETNSAVVVWGCSAVWCGEQQWSGNVQCGLVVWKGMWMKHEWVVCGVEMCYVVESVGYSV